MSCRAGRLRPCSPRSRSIQPIRPLPRPSKPIGPIYGEAEARQLSARTAWTFMPDGRGFRRAVPSPAPRRIREINVIKLLVQAGMVVICAGGGGIPVIATAAGALRGIEAVIDKDLSSALLAEEIGADALLLLTDVAAVWTKWPMSEGGMPIGHITPGIAAHLSHSILVRWRRKSRPPVVLPNAWGALQALEPSIRPRPSLRVRQERSWP